MFDPDTVAFEIKYPWRNRRGYRPTFITIWHKDPCKDGTDNSCDWTGNKKQSPQLKQMGEAIRDLETILDNGPFYPNHSAHLRFQPIKECYWQMKKKSRFRIHPRYHFWHWRIQFRPYQIFMRWAFERCCICKKGYRWNESVVGNWAGNKTWHHGCDKHTYIQEIK